MAGDQDASPASYPAGTLGTLMEIYQQATEDFVAYLRARTPVELSAGAVFNGRTVTIKEILNHVVYAGNEFANDLRRGLGRPMDQSAAPADVIEAIVAIAPRTAAALERAWHLTDPEIGKVLIDQPWNVRYTLEQVMEHAIVHILWHKRQCKRVWERAAKGASC
jgi:hypothetical protein